MIEEHACKSDKETKTELIDVFPYLELKEEHSHAMKPDSSKRACVSRVRVSDTDMLTKRVLRILILGVTMSMSDSRIFVSSVPVSGDLAYNRIIMWLSFFKL